MPWTVGVIILLLLDSGNSAATSEETRLVSVAGRRRWNGLLRRSWQAEALSRRTMLAAMMPYIDILPISADNRTAVDRQLPIEIGRRI
jgi:hypothetical protein